MNEFVTFVEVAREVFVRVVVDENFLVSQVLFVEARDNRACVQDVGDTALLQRLQVSRGANGTYKQAKVGVSEKDAQTGTYAFTSISMLVAAASSKRTNEQPG